MARTLVFVRGMAAALSPRVAASCHHLKGLGTFLSGAAAVQAALLTWVPQSMLQARNACIRVRASGQMDSVNALLDQVSQEVPYNLMPVATPPPKSASGQADVLKHAAGRKKLRKSTGNPLCAPCGNDYSPQFMQNAVGHAHMTPCCALLACSNNTLQVARAAHWTCCV